METWFFSYFFYEKAQNNLILQFLSLCQFVCLCVFVMVRNEIVSSQAVRGARSSGRNLHALLAAPVAGPRERRQVGTSPWYPDRLGNPYAHVKQTAPQAKQSHTETSQPHTGGAMQSITAGLAAS